MSVEVNDFQKDVLDASQTAPVLVDFWAAWCGPCRMLGPVLDKLAAQADGQWLLRKVDVDRFPEVAGQYGIRGIPNVKLIHKGQVVNEFAGALRQAQVEQFLATNLPA